MPRWFCAWSKQKHGPFAWDELRQLADAGKLQQGDMVLEEGTAKWLAAGALDGLFQDKPAPTWFCAIKKTKAGPFTFSQLVELQAAGRLTVDDMVLEVGTTQWKKADSVTDLFPPAPPPKDRQTCFLEDLRRVFRLSVSLSIPEILGLLSQRFQAWRQTSNKRGTTFLADLRKVFAGFRGPDLSVLGARLTHWRTTKLTEMQAYLKDLPDDDPMRCPISLFATMDYGRLEIAHTRTLAWLLSPYEPHGFGTRLLVSLFAALQDGPQGLLKVEKVESEYRPSALWSSDPGRIDILVLGHSLDELEKPSPWLIAIEAKIDAAEAEGQLQQYEEWIRAYGHGRHIIRVFLTPEGRSPTTAKQEWVQLSFVDLARIFRRVFPELRDKPGFHFLRFFVAGVFKDICRWSVPIQPSEYCEDPYGIVAYLKTVRETNTKEVSHGRIG